MRSGTVRFLVSPNLLHHLFLGEWKAAYPDARLYASPGLRKKRKDLAFDADLGDAPDPAWAADIDQVMVKGSPWLTEVVFFHRASGTAIFTDLIENFRARLVQGLEGLCCPSRRHRRSRIPAPRANCAGASCFAAARRGPPLERILAWPIEPGRHGPWRHGDGRRRRLRAQGLRLAAVRPSAMAQVAA